MDSALSTSVALDSASRPRQDRDWLTRELNQALTRTWSKGATLPMARAFGVAVVRAWWAEVAGADQIRPFLIDFETGKLPTDIGKVAAELGKAVAQAATVETGAYQIGIIYTGMLPITHRSAHGIFYTPPALTARLLNLAESAGVDWSTARALDPACGGGAFLTPMAERIRAALKRRKPKTIVEHIGKHLRGYDLDPFGAWLSQVCLDASMLPVTRTAGATLPQLIEVGDSLTRTPPTEGFDLVIGNPPYGRVKLDAEQRARFKRSLYGHSNLYGLFTDLALQHTRPGGVVAFVTPTSFLAGQYYKNLRALLAREAPPIAIDFITARKGVFDEVLQETLLATYKRGAKPTRIAVTQLHPSTDTDLALEDVGTVSLPRKRSEPWLLPRSAAEATLVRRMSKMTARLSDWGYGVSTGPLVWNRHKDQLVEKPGKDRYPLIWAESVTANGRFHFSATRRNHVPYFHHKDAGDDWLVTNRPCVLLQRTTAKEQHRRLIAADLPPEFIRKHGSVVIENHLNMVRPAVSKPSVDTATIAAFLNSTAADRAFRCISGSVAVSAFELEAMPLPDATELALLQALVSKGAARAEIEVECARLYA